eukprot:scaffold8931_cov75-Isochrysis_galbana.AAC.1
MQPTLSSAGAPTARMAQNSLGIARKAGKSGGGGGVASCVHRHQFTVAFCVHRHPTDWSAGMPTGRMAGKRSTSLIDSLSVRSMVRRSMPIPHPAVGGSPYSRA